MLKLYAADGGFATTGGYKPMHGGYDFGGDVIYQIAPWIGIGAGAGCLRSPRSSTMTTMVGTESLIVTGKPVVSAVPVRLAGTKTGFCGQKPVSKAEGLLRERTYFIYFVMVALAKAHT